MVLEYCVSNGIGRLKEVFGQLDVFTQIKVHGELGAVDMFAVIDGGLTGLLDRQIAELELRIEQTNASDGDGGEPTFRSLHRSCRQHRADR